MEEEKQKENQVEIRTTMERQKGESDRKKRKITRNKNKCQYTIICPAKGFPMLGTHPCYIPRVLTDNYKLKFHRHPPQ